MSKITHANWYTNSQGTIGIVRVQTDDNGIEYYIGRAIMEREDEDAQYIAEFGASYPKRAGDALFGIMPTSIGTMIKDVEGTMPYTKLNSNAAKVEIGRHPIYLGGA